MEPRKQVLYGVWGHGSLRWRCCLWVREAGHLNFHRRFIPRCVHLLQPLTDFLQIIKGPLTSIVCNPNAADACVATKSSLANAAFLSHPLTEPSARIMVDAAILAVGPILQGQILQQWRPLSLFSQNLPPAEMHYITPRLPMWIRQSRKHQADCSESEEEWMLFFYS